MSHPPCQTIYVHNLHEKIKEDELKKSLYHVFSQFGNVLEVCAKKTYSLRGQAWISFDDLGAATKAVREMMNFNFYGKPMQVSFAKEKADVLTKADGTYVQRPKRKTSEKDAEKGKDKKKENGTKKPKKGEESAVVESEHKEKETPAPPNKVLFIENLPEQANAQVLSLLFQQYSGFKEVRLIPNKTGIAFAEFEDMMQAATAKQALVGFQITPSHSMKITFAKQ